MTRVLSTLAALPSWLQPVFLTLVRLYWGWAFLWTGWGKLTNIEQIAAWFGDELHIPLPLLNAYLAAGTECVGGALLLAGLGTRYAGAALAFTMVVAYATSDAAALQSLWMSAAACEAHPTCIPFEDAAPFSFLMAASIALLWGAGPVSLDRLLRGRGLGAFLLEPDPAP